MTASFDVDHFVPLGSLHLVLLCDPAEQTSGGVWLPETAQSNYSEAVIKRSGPGWKIPDTDHRALSWLQQGWHIVFKPENYTPLYRGARIGFVRDESVMATVVRDDLKPLGDWVKVSVDAWEATSDTILVPEELQRRPRSGTVLDWGPGVLITRGDLIGCRLTIPTTLQMSPKKFDHARVTWGVDAEIVDLGREGVECAFIRAGDLDCIEEAENADRHERPTVSS